MKQLELFRDYTAGNLSDSKDVIVPTMCSPKETQELASLIVPGDCHDEVEALTNDVANGPPKAMPLPEAIQAGVFGVDTEGPIVPSEEQLADLTAEHANEMIILLADSQVMEEALRLEHDPATHRIPKTEEQKQKLLARVDKEWKRLVQAYADAVAAYAEGFGDEAAEKLDQWVRMTVADGAQKKEPYPPSHPWHYFHAGDNATPMPVESIPSNTEAGKWLAERLPKNPAKRKQKLRDMLAHEHTVLAADKARYADIVERGAEALSQYDLTIAHASDAMAVATALALKYTHVSLSLGRVAWLANALRQVSPNLLPVSERRGSNRAPLKRQRLSKNRGPLQVEP